MPYAGRFVLFPPFGLIVGRAGDARKTAVPFFSLRAILFNKNSLL